MAQKIQLENDKLKKLLSEKIKLINSGIKISVEIEGIEEEMSSVDKEIQEQEKNVDISDLYEKEKELSDRVQQCITEMEEVKKEVYARMKAQIPQDLYTKYEELTAKKEALEEDRNKIAIKAQKYNDKIIPEGRKAMKIYLKDEYDDYETLTLEDGKVMCSLFNHLEEFKTNFKKK